MRRTKIASENCINSKNAMLFGAASSVLIRTLGTKGWLNHHDLCTMEQLLSCQHLNTKICKEQIKLRMLNHLARPFCLKMETETEIKYNDKSKVFPKIVTKNNVEESSSTKDASSSAING